MKRPLAWYMASTALPPRSDRRSDDNSAQNSQLRVGLEVSAPPACQNCPAPVHLSHAMPAATQLISSKHPIIHLRSSVPSADTPTHQEMASVSRTAFLKFQPSACLPCRRQVQVLQSRGLHSTMPFGLQRLASVAAPAARRLQAPLSVRCLATKGGSDKSWTEIAAEAGQLAT